MSDIFATGPFEFDAASGLLYRGEQETLLPLRAAKVLEVFLRRPGEVLSKDELLSAVWEDAFVGEDSLTQAISMVRGALGDDPHNPTYIQTIPKRGYRFIAEVSVEPAGSGAEGRDVAAQKSGPSGTTSPFDAAGAQPGGHEEALAEPGGVAKPVIPDVVVQASRVRALPWVVVIVALIVTAGAIAWGLRNVELFAPPQLSYLQIDCVPGADGFIVGVPVISPDGTRIACVAQVESSRRLYLRSLDSDEATVVPVTEPNPRDVFFSQDGNSVGFRVADGLKRVSFGGGSPSTISRFASSIYGGSWGPDDTIYFGTEHGGIFSVPASGGDPTPIIPPDRKAGENYLVHPEVLPGGRAMLYDVSYGGRLDDEPIFVIDFETDERKKLVEQGSMPQYAASGHIVYARRGQLLAVLFDLERLEVSGEPVVVRDDVLISGTFSTAFFDISRNGRLVYVRGGDVIGNRRLILANREGGEDFITGDRDSFMWPRFSPDGRRVAVSNIEGDLLIYALEWGTRTRLNFAGITMGPFWSPDGERIVFSRSNRSPVDVYWGPDGPGEAKPLWESDNTTYPMSWSSDGQLLAIEDLYPETGYDISILRLGDSRVTKEVFLNTGFQEMGPMFSPAGPWIAYTSNEAGRRDVYVEPYPRTGERYMVSDQGGREPVWARDGSELFYKTDNTSTTRASAPYRIMVVDIQMQPEFKHSEPRVLLEGRYERPGEPSYDVAPDGRFVVLRREDVPQPTSYEIVLNWFEELKRLVQEGQ